MSRRRGRNPIAAWFMIILIVAMVFIIIGVSAYLVEVAGYDGRRQWWLMLPAAALSILVVWRGSRWFDTGPLYLSAEEHMQQFEIALERRHKELLRHPNPRYRRYAALVAERQMVSEGEIRVREARLAEIASDPVKAKYADRIFRGERIDDETIAYWEDPAARRTCAHLDELEGDLKRADPTMRPWYGNVVTERDADWPALRRQYPSVAALRFEESGQDERGEPYGARIVCERHKSSILFGLGAKFPG